MKYIYIAITSIIISLNIFNFTYAEESSIAFDAVRIETDIMNTIVDITEETISIEEPVSNRWGIALSEEEKYILAQIVNLESGNQSDLGQQAVIEVIFNRMKSSSFSDSLIGVLSERRQFSTWKSRNKANPTDREYRNIEAVLNGQSNITPYKTVFFSRKPQNKRLQCIIEDHAFCNEL